jgi:hypothetical protein
MLRKHSLVNCMAMALLAAPAWAGIVQDPTGGVEADNFSSPISTFSGHIDPTANNGVIGLFNDTGNIITELSLHTTIATNLTPADISSSFTCNSGPANPFFINCEFDYIGQTGSLTLRFFGVNPSDADEFAGIDPEIFEQEGIPPVVGSCLLTPDATGCNIVGHFAFVFNNGFQTTGNVTNGWTPDATSTANPGTRLFNGPPEFDPPGFADAPEPSGLFLLGAGVFALAGWLRRHRDRHPRA